jgi:hypothetical protein
MEKYSLEISNWGTYELVKDFSSMSGAVNHGRDQFPQNEWRVFDRVGGKIVYENDPFGSIAEQASQEIKRFDDTEKWRLRFQQQAEREVVARQERERLAEIASRQRQAQRQFRDIPQERRDRLEGFHFVGAPPAIPQSTQASFGGEWEDDDEDEWDWDDDERLDLSREKVNWLVEGF